MLKKTTVVAAVLFSFSMGFGAFAGYAVFGDVPAGHWAETSINAMDSMGIMKGPGSTPGKFNPAGKVNRAELAVVSNRLYEALDKRITALEGTSEVINVINADPSLAVMAKDLPPVTAADHKNGNADAAITIVEYSDFDCPFCERVHPTMKKLVTDYEGKVNWVYRHYPLAFHDPSATRKAIASECVAEFKGNEAFWKFTDKLYSDATSDSDASIRALAVAVGVDEKNMIECMDSGRYDALIESHLTGGAKAGVNGTPGSFVIDNKSGHIIPVIGAQPVEQFKSVIDGMLKK